MIDKQIPLHAVPVMHALARTADATTFAELKDSTGLTQATLNRILNSLCLYGYAIKAGHGRYMAGPELVDLGVSVTSNQVVSRFKPILAKLMNATQLNAEVYMITPGGPLYLAHKPARGEINVTFRFGHVIANRTAHPAGLFFLAIHKGERPGGYKDNFIVDRGGQWPELFRAAVMAPGSNYCLALSGMLSHVNEERHTELKEALHQFCQEIEVSK